MSRLKYALLCVAVLAGVHTASAQEPWDPATYPDERGFQQRMAPMLERIAAGGFGIRSLAHSKCPDTGLPVKTWAIKGDTIISPYTGRKYVQGETGYFGPKARNEAGEIIAFGGDPLKYDLPPATATLLLNPDDEKARTFLSIPGNLRQQYHFACKNCARFYPLLADTMGEEWRSEFPRSVGDYAEKRRPSDGSSREWLDLSKAHNLVGEPGELLGGNTFDGGTENHKTMWRSSALLYSQLFPEDALISGYPAAEAARLTKQMLVDYMKRLLQVGNGEYDSEVYYPHSIEAFLNLYDFSPDPETKRFAQLILDYYFATYGLKVVDGAQAGAMKRGYLPDSELDEMEAMQWAFFNRTSRDMASAKVTIQQATTTYRPNRVIYNITRKNISLPFEAKMSRPFYHMDYPHAFAETFYHSAHFALGNVQMTIVDNPNQQMVWSVIAEGENGPLAFSGGHPMRESTSGHSPYTQTLHSKGTIIVLTAPSQVAGSTAVIGPQGATLQRANLWHLPKEHQPLEFEQANRQKYASAPLHPISEPDDTSAESIADFWRQSQGSASTWFYYPKSIQPQWIDEVYYFDAHQVWVAVRPLTPHHFRVAPSEDVVDELSSRKAKRFFQDYHLLSVLGEASGYIVEVAEKSDYDSMAKFVRALETRTFTATGDLRSIAYESIHGDKMEMVYEPSGLRCQARINGEVQDWSNHTEGAVYQSPYIKVKDGVFTLDDGQEGYKVDFTGDRPIWSSLY
ncbi:MAG: hypothetical protein AAGA85_20330 [Bacteroidota bacterium]